MMQTGYDMPGLKHTLGVTSGLTSLVQTLEYALTRRRSSLRFWKQRTVAPSSTTGNLKLERNTDSLWN